MRVLEQFYLEWSTHVTGVICVIQRSPTGKLFVVALTVLRFSWRFLYSDCGWYRTSRAADDFADVVNIWWQLDTPSAEIIHTYTIVELSCVVTVLWFVMHWWLTLMPLLWRLGSSVLKIKVICRWVVIFNVAKMAIAITMSAVPKLVMSDNDCSNKNVAGVWTGSVLPLTLVRSLFS